MCSERVLGEKVGAVLQKMHESKGIMFHMDASVDSAEPSSSDKSKVGGVKLKDGKTIPADVVIMAVGIGPATEFLKESGFNLEKDGSLKVDKWLRVVGVPDVYATGLLPPAAPKSPLGIRSEWLMVGDIATFPYVQQNNKPLRIEHWDVAINHGRSVANHIVKGDSFEGISCGRPPKPS